MEVFEKCLGIVFSLLILGQAYLIRRHVGTWLFPACLFGLFWFGYTFFPLVILFWVPVEPYAVGFIFLCTLAFSTSSLAFDWKTAFERNRQKRSANVALYANPLVKWAFYLVSVTSVVCLVLNSLAQGISVYDLIFDLYASAATYAEMRYTEGLNVNIFGQLSIICAYLGAILGGLLLPCTPAKANKWAIAVLSFLPPLFVTLTQSARGLLFLCVGFFYGAQLVYKVMSDNFRLLERRSVKRLTLYSIVLLPLLTFSFLARGLYSLEDTDFVINRVISYFASYTCGHIYAFGDWFASIIGRHSALYYPHEGPSHGFYTFMALFKWMGSTKVAPIGIFDDYYTYRDLLGSNIFTMFRGLIQDFGLAGSLLFMLLTGLLLHKLFFAMLQSKRPVFSVAVFIFMIGYFYSSFGVSMLTWSSNYVTFLLLWVVLYVSKAHGDVYGPKLALAR